MNTTHRVTTRLQSNSTRSFSSSGVVSNVVLYNLANAHFKNNQLGSAILCYEKAQRLAPHDREISENLNFARTRIADKVERPPEGLFVSLVTRITNWLSLDTETALAVVFFFTANAAFALFWLDAIPGLSRLALYASGDGTPQPRIFTGLPFYPWASPSETKIRLCSSAATTRTKTSPSPGRRGLRPPRALPPTTFSLTEFDSRTPRRPP